MKQPTTPAAGSPTAEPSSRQRRAPHTDSVNSSREDEYLLLLDTINTHVFYLADPATYGMVNRAHADFFGLNKTDLEYTSLYDILDRQEAETCIAGNAKIFAEKKQIVTEEILRGADGQSRVFSFTKTPSLNAAGEVRHVVCTGEDITEKRLAEAELEKSRHFLNSIIESIQDGLSVLDKNLNILHTNGVMREWYRESGSLVGQKCYAAYHQTDTICHGCPTVKALHSGSSETEIIAGPAGSSVEWLELSSFPLKDAETAEITGVIEFVRDITDRITLENQVIQAQKMKAVGTLSSGIAHDFNNILQTILGSIQLLIQDRDQSHPDLRHLLLIEKAVNRARDLTSRLLYFNREIKSDLQPLHLNEELRNLVQLLERSLPKMVSIEQHYGQHLKTILADTVQIEQVVLNLAINASHAMPDGGTLRLKTVNSIVDDAQAKATPDLEAGEYVALSVSDTGVGMDQQTLSRIYDPFFTTKETNAGTGLGLSMVYGIVKNHNGVITCRSAPGEGTTFTLYFPVLTDARVAVSSPSPERTPATGKEVVLVVDDDPFLRQIAAEILQKLGYRTLQSASGEDALATLKENEAQVDLVLLDLNMPGMGGHKCLPQIQKLPSAPKVIIASGYAADSNTRQMVEAGASAFLQKPYRLQELAAAVRKALDDRR